MVLSLPHTFILRLSLSLLLLRVVLTRAADGVQAGYGRYTTHTADGKVEVYDGYALAASLAG